MQARTPVTRVVLLLALFGSPIACGGAAVPPPQIVVAAAPAAPPPSTTFGAADVFAALKARDSAKLTTILAASPALAGARRHDGVSAIVEALFTLNDDEETFVKPPENALLRALVACHPPLDVYDAAAIGDVERLRAVLAGDRALANVVHPKLGITPLHFAAFGGSAGAVELLLARGAALDPASRNSFHNTPFLLSIVADQYDAASLLLARGANVEATEEAGVRAIHLAASLGDVRLLALLLANRAKVEAKTDDGKTALAFAVERKHEDAARFLRAHGAI